METYGIAETKAQFSEIIGRVEAGERVTVTRRGICRGSPSCTLVTADRTPFRAARNVDTEAQLIP